MIAPLRQLCDSILRMIYPHVCAVCHDSLVEGEQVMCLRCLTELPRTMTHTLTNNTLHERVAAPGVAVDRAAAWFNYARHNEYARIIHDAKYHGMANLAHQCGAIYAREIAGSGFFDGVDLLLPVAMHRQKLRERGYNQARLIAEGIGSVTGIAVGDNLIAAKKHATQTRKNSWQRWINTRDVYTVARPIELEGLHVMLVDDVITTGATMLACLTAIHDAVHNVTTSFVTLAATARG